MSIHHQRLEVETNASQDDIKKAYRRLARKYHPDRNIGDTEAETKFKEIKESYDVLTGKTQEQSHNPFDIFGDIFNFGGRQQRRQETVISTYVEFWDAVKGITQNLDLRQHIDCEACNGQGGSDLVDCKRCSGKGHISQQMSANFRVQTTCPECQGAKNKPNKICDACKGQKTIEKESKITVNIPAGISNGDVLRTTQEGRPVMVRVNVGQHPYFERHGDNLVYRLPVHYADVVIGSTVKVPTLDKEEDLNIPAGTKSGTFLKLSGGGFKNVMTGRQGDVAIQVLVDSPSVKSKEQEELLVKLRDMEDKSAWHKSFWENARKSD